MKRIHSVIGKRKPKSKPDEFIVGNTLDQDLSKTQSRSFHFSPKIFSAISVFIAIFGVYTIFFSKAAPTTVANVWVASNGSDTGSNCKRFASPTANPDSSGATLCKTLNVAWSKTSVTNGDTVRVMAGNYPAQFVEGDRDVETKIIADDGTKAAGSNTCRWTNAQRTQAEYGAYGVFCANAKNMTLENMILDAQDDPSVASGSEINGAYVKYKNVSLYGNYVNITIHGSNFIWQGGSHGQDGIDGGQRSCQMTAGEPVWIYGPNATIDGVRFNPKKIKVGGAQGVCGTDLTPHIENIRLESGANNFTLKNSWFVAGSQAGSGHIFSSLPVTGLTLINNVFEDLEGTYSIQTASSGCDWTVMYNTFMDGISKSGCPSGDQSKWVGNLGVASSCGGTHIKNVWQGTGTCSGDTFVGNQSLGVGSGGVLTSASSPAYNAGESDTATDYCTNPSYVASVDFKGNTRPYGTNCDAGAHEYGSSPGGSGGGCLNSGADIATALSSAPAGSTICLNAGTYTYSSGNINKTTMTTVTAAPGVNKSAIIVSSVIDVQTSNNLTFDNITFSGGGQLGTGSAPATNISIKNSSFKKGLCINQPTGATNLNINVESSDFTEIGQGGCSNEGRLTVNGRNTNKPSVTSVNSGITIKNNLFNNTQAGLISGANCTDGIQLTAGASGVNIINNTFHGLIEGQCAESQPNNLGPHVDAIQLYDAKNARIEGNYVYGNSTGLVVYDHNGSPMDVINNVFVKGPEGHQALEVSGTGDKFDHNTIIGTAIIGLWNGNQSSNETITNNVITGGISYNGGSSSGFVTNNNLTSIPVFKSSTPASHDDYLITAPVAALTGASDGSAIGIYALGSTAPSPDTTLPDTSITSSTPANGGSTTIPTASVTFSGIDNVGVTSYECSLDSTTTYTTCTSPKNYTGLSGGSHTIRVRAKDAAGNTDASPASITFTITSTSSCSSKPGDASGDSVVNITDIATILSVYGQTNSTSCADLNKDTVINITDIAVVLQNYGK